MTHHFGSAEKGTNPGKDAAPDFALHPAPSAFTSLARRAISSNAIGERASTPRSHHGQTVLRVESQPRLGKI